MAFDGNTRTLTGYLNGTSFGWQSTSFSSMPRHPGRIAIGRIDIDTRFSNTESPASGAHFNGVLDEVALYNDVLSQDRLELHAQGCSRSAIAVVKTGPLSATLGDSAVYTFTVINTGNMALRNVQVEDDVAGPGRLADGDGNGNNWLDVAEAWVYTTAHTIPASISDSLTNTVTVTATDSLSTIVTASDTHRLDVAFWPVLTITKEGPGAADVGDTVVYTFTVSHDGSSDGPPVSMLSVTDTIAGVGVLDNSGDTNSNAKLDASETWVYTASYTVQPTDSNPLVGTATLIGLDRDGDNVTATDMQTTTLSGFNPVLRIGCR